MHRFSFFIYNYKNPINNNHVLWKQPLPTKRKNNFSKESNNLFEIITYGNYFTILSFAIKKDNFKSLLNAIFKKTNLSLTSFNIDHVLICLKKHGAFYHPAKLKVFFDNKSLSFVVNVAISKKGKICMKQEIAALTSISFNKISNKISYFLPNVYSYSFYNYFLNIEFSLFIGEWFENFHEFHLTLKEEKKTIVVWKSYNKNQYLSKNQTKDLYYQISKILSSYYDPISTKHISPWHNAAGDFVIKITKKCLRVRLITVRNLTPLIANCVCKNKDLSENKIIFALMIFFLETSLRIRLDRIDGVKNLVLASEKYIPPIVKGFFKGLSLSAEKNGFPSNFNILFKNYILSYSEKDLLNIANQTINKIYKRRKEELSIISLELNNHVKKMYQTIKNINTFE